MTILLIIFAICTFSLLVWVLWKMTELDERQEEMDKYSVYLDERANRISQEEEDLRALVREFRSRDIYIASYTDTDQDLMKYTNDASMESHARRHIANAIAQDIVKQFKAVESKTEDGRRKFTYRFKIAEQ